MEIAGEKVSGTTDVHLMYENFQRSRFLTVCWGHPSLPSQFVKTAALSHWFPALPKVLQVLHEHVLFLVRQAAFRVVVCEFDYRAPIRVARQGRDAASPHVNI